MRRVLPIFMLFALLAVQASAQQAHVKPGVEVLAEKYADKLAGKRVGLLTNPTGIDTHGVSTIDRVAALPGVKLVRLFAPEHGLRGGFKAGESVDETKDPVTGLPVVSLFGDSRRPSAASLAGLDVVLYDIQDIGSRSYTFVSSLTYMMEACEEAGVAVWVLDRPDPLGGDKPGGPMMDAANESFVGVHDVPQVYALTPGEWAKLIKAERTPKLDLTVVPMEGWRRGMLYGDLGWVWVPPSEHVPRWETSFFYAMTGTYGELGKVSEGVGTPLPFELVGAPWIDGVRLAAALNGRKPAGVWFRPTSFKPRYGTYSGQPCQGVQIHLLDARACNPAAVGIAIMETLQGLYPERGIFKPAATDEYQMFKRALGDSAIADMLAEGKFDGIADRILEGLKAYQVRRQGVLIYQ